jgi:hypothetical protein
MFYITRISTHSCCLCMTTTQFHGCDTIHISLHTDKYKPFHVIYTLSVCVPLPYTSNIDLQWMTENDCIYRQESYCIGQTREIKTAYVISTSEDSPTFCLQTAHVADKNISFTVTTRPPSIPVRATFHPSTVISLPCCANIRNTCPFYPHLTDNTTPVKCKAPTQKQLSRSTRILKHINRTRLTAECVCYAGTIIIGKGEEQNQQ